MYFSLCCVDKTTKSMNDPLKTEKGNLFEERKGWDLLYIFSLIRPPFQWL